LREATTDPEDATVDAQLSHWAALFNGCGHALALAFPVAMVMLSGIAHFVTFLNWARPLLSFTSRRERAVPGGSARWVTNNAGSAPTDLPHQSQQAETTAASGFVGYALSHLRPTAIRSRRQAHAILLTRPGCALHATLGIEGCVIVQSAVHRDRQPGGRGCADGKARRLSGHCPAAPGVAESYDALTTLGFRGVRFNFIKHLCPTSIDEILDLAPRLADIEWHLQIHRERSLIEMMGPALERSPVPVAIDHIGRIDAGLGLGQAAFQHLLHLPEHDRFWVKVSGCDRITRTGPP
jgi:hypothetical protein